MSRRGGSSVGCLASSRENNLGGYGHTQPTADERGFVALGALFSRKFAAALVRTSMNNEYKRG